ncbi:uncharacterized protein LOC131218704 isoform X2 [Magnolia sinica]|uniref:uncharacterized protein LOC131218704 isoform X2 n=1 Tax=Magnolia sinica TaxID=86752 RepID=UPI00265B3289|nr:uncharacterized protein LOC131218704 isoform X2 [Magnolia sinica]
MIWKEDRCEAYLHQRRCEASFYPHNHILLSTIETQSRAAFGLGKLSEHSFDRASGVGSRYGEPEVENVLPVTWYDQYAEKHRTSRQQRLPSGDKEPLKRTPEGMSSYLRLLEKHKRRRQAFKDDQYMGFANPSWGNGSHIHPNAVSDANNAIEDETSFFPEIMFPSDCIPDSALPRSRQEDNQKLEFYSVLDNLPHVTSRSAAMIERFGVMPDYLRMGLGRSNRGKNGPEGNRKSLSQEQASQMTQKVLARVLANVGIEGATEVSMEVLSQFLSCHISKLGRILKVLTDSYRKQCSATELIKMFLQTVGYGNLGALSDQLMDGSKVFSHQTQQHVRGPQSQHQNTLLQAQQMQRHMSPQLHMFHPQNLALQQQQQWNKLQRRQPSTPRSAAGLTSEKDRPVVEVKIENTSELPIDGTFSAINRQQFQLRQQQMPMVNSHAQSSHQFKQLTSLQIPQLQTQSMFSVRTPPVKVEGFQELMGGDATSKHDSEEHKLTSPSK